MYELASASIGAVPILLELLAKLSLVEYRHVTLDHHVRLGVGEGAL